MTHRRRLVLAALLALVLPAAARAQDPRRPRREILGLDFRADGVWRRLARAVRERRALLLSQGAFGALNAPRAAGVPAPASVAVTGLLRVPVVMFQYQDIAAQHVASEYDSVLFGGTPPLGRPYTYHSYYAEMSGSLLDIEGTTFGPVTLDSNEITYAGTPPCTGNPFPGSTQCNGLFTNSQVFTPVQRMQSALREALSKLDNGSIDWSQFDRDTDGVVDLVAFIQPAPDGACGGTGNNHLWAHRYQLLTPYTTKTPSTRNASGFIQVSDYILESGVGGLSGCDASAIMPVGTVAHETGHGFGLPDLYDTGETSEGIGEYSLMSSGNYTTGLSPSRMDTWSLGELGWVTLVAADTSGHYTFGAAPTSDTAFLVRPPGSNPRGEYFLLENRQAVRSDSAMLRYHCQVSYRPSTPPPTCGGGLLVYHVDSEQIAQHGISLDNRVNAGPIHGLEVLQADGRGNLDANPNSSCAGAGAGCSDRGDAGDPYPGVTGNTTLATTTNPNDLLNTGLCSGFRLDSITQLVPGGAMRFKLTLGVIDTLAFATAPALAAGLWGYAYGTTLGVTCGTGTLAWTVDSGVPPPGVTLSATGVLGGAPTDTGLYTFRVKVTAGSSTATRTFTLQIAEPVLTLQQVLGLAFQGPGAISDDQRRYLDAQGNANGIFDIGDVLRWLERTGNVAATGTALRLARERRRVAQP